MKINGPHLLLNMCLSFLVQITRVSLYLNVHADAYAQARYILRYNRELDGNQLCAYCFEFRITTPKRLEILRDRRINLVIPTRLIA